MIIDCLFCRDKNISMTTMAKLEQELAKLDQEREALRGPGSYTKTTVTTKSIYQSEPRKYRPVSPPKARAPGSLPPSGPHKGRNLIHKIQLSNSSYCRIIF